MSSIKNGKAIQSRYLNFFSIPCTIQPGRRYIIKKMFGSSRSNETHDLDLIEDLLVETKRTLKYTENDYFRIIWSRLIELAINNKSIRIKSTESKEKLISNDNNITGFKIDPYVEIDVNENGNDVMSMEVAKEDQGTKVIKGIAQNERYCLDQFKYLQLIDFRKTIEYLLAMKIFEHSHIFAQLDYITQKHYLKILTFAVARIVEADNNTKKMMRGLTNAEKYRLRRDVVLYNILNPFLFSQVVIFIDAHGIIRLLIFLTTYSLINYDRFSKEIVYEVNIS
ncbi:hypothetical protein BDA99DRAFT_536251 [Phascolomyces articulosus]|uniref:Uncharacterized protein n=1 Tax=Phascolomyces articulosus TaxID=60185 RepID=A0AAD5PFG1_9FUNG|nr:hypothetical protein BDA99DRAFT_536251 [Phascolomyces articulosus]